MTQELLQKLISHYTKCIEEMPEGLWVDYLFDNHVLYGICGCAKKKFYINICGSDFVKEFANGEEYLCSPLIVADSYSEAKDLLQIRLDRLKEFVK